MNNRWRRVERLKQKEFRASLQYRVHKAVNQMAEAADEIHISQESAEKLGEALRVQAEARYRIQREEVTFGHQIQRLKVALEGFLPTAIKKYFR